jgi:hypothetical protein
MKQVTALMLAATMTAPRAPSSHPPPRAVYRSGNDRH